MRVLTVVGARPQFVKAAPLSRALKKAGIQERIVHTGQHYDREMSDVFFEELGIETPAINLAVGSGSHGAQTGRMLQLLDEVCRQESPDWVLVFGDTNSTLAGALAATKLGMKCAHIEAGLRSFNRRMPEELNRVVTDHVADLLLCPSPTAIDNLRKEGITRGVHCVGDIMYDAVRMALHASDPSDLLQRLDLSPGQFALGTCHRAANTDSRENLQMVLECLAQSGMPVVFPVHPRTAQAISRFCLEVPPSVRLIAPLGYRDMLALIQSARLVLTDSGGVQKEAFWLRTPCITLRNETEWTETVELGWNRLVGLDPEHVARAARASIPDDAPPPVYGAGHAAESIVQLIRDTA